MNLSITFNKPIGNGIITALNRKQALERSGKLKSNKIIRIGSCESSHIYS